MPQAGFPGIGPDPGLSINGLVAWARRARVLLDNILRGKLNCTVDLTISTGTTTTTLAHPLIGGTSQFAFSARSAAGAVLLQTLYHDTPDAESVVLNHAGPSEDVTLDCIIIG